METANLTTCLSTRLQEGMKQWTWNPMRKKSCYGPAPDIRGTVNAYWIEKREARLKRQASSRKQQASRKKEFDKPIDLWDKVI